MKTMRGRGGCHGNRWGLLTQTGEAGDAFPRERFLSWDLKDERQVNRVGHFHTWGAAFTRTRKVPLYTTHKKYSIPKINSINKSVGIKKLLIHFKIITVYVSNSISNMLNINLFYLQGSILLALKIKLLYIISDLQTSS